MKRESVVHDGIYLCFDGELHHIDFHKLVGKRVTIYGQQEVVKDLIAKRLADGGQILFECSDASVHGFDGKAPQIRFRHNGETKEIDCDFIGGCDGFHGVCRPSIPAKSISIYEREYPFGWLGILAEAPPVADELIYAYHPRGFALFSMRSPTLVRYYLQCAPDEDLDQWPDERIWDELETQARRHAAAEARAARGKDRRADALVRRRADAVRAAVPRRRQRPHRAADRRQGHEPGVRRRARALARHRRVLQERLDRSARQLFGNLPAPRLEGAALLLVDDAADAPVPGGERRSTGGARSPSSTT